MIFDKLENIDKYSQIPQNARDFIKTLTPQTTCGRHEIDANIYANIEEYETKPIEKCQLEAHKKYIDIQMLLDGKEELDYTSIDGLEISKAYNPTKDVMFFKTPERRLNSVILEKGYFALLYPYEAHQPQMNYADKTACVKKVVVKIRA